MTGYVRWPMRPRSVVISCSSDESAQEAMIDHLLPIRAGMAVRLLLRDGSAVWVRMSADDAERMELLPGQTLYVALQTGKEFHRSNHAGAELHTLSARRIDPPTFKDAPAPEGNPRRGNLPTTSRSTDRWDMVVCAALLILGLVANVAPGVRSLSPPALAGEGLFGAGGTSIVTEEPSE